MPPTLPKPRRTVTARFRSPSVKSSTAVSNFDDSTDFSESIDYRGMPALTPISQTYKTAQTTAAKLIDVLFLGLARRTRNLAVVFQSSDNVDDFLLS